MRVSNSINACRKKNTKSKGWKVVRQMFFFFNVNKRGSPIKAILHEDVFKAETESYVEDIHILLTTINKKEGL
jgi:hypothetical protein